MASETSDVISLQHDLRVIVDDYIKFIINPYGANATTLLHLYGYTEAERGTQFNDRKDKVEFNLKNEIKARIGFVFEWKEPDGTHLKIHAAIYVYNLGMYILMRLFENIFCILFMKISN